MKYILAASVAVGLIGGANLTSAQDAICESDQPNCLNIKENAIEKYNSKPTEAVAEMRGGRTDEEAKEGDIGGKKTVIGD